MSRFRPIPPFILGLISFFLLNISFFAMNYWKRGTFTLSPFNYVKLLVAFNLIWLMVSILMQKFNHNAYRVYKDSIILLVKSVVITGYLVCFMVVFMGLFAFSRLHIFGTLVLFLFGEICILTIYYLITARSLEIPDEKDKEGIYLQQRISWRLLFADFVLLNASFFVVNYFKRGSVNLKPGYGLLLIVIYGVWFLASLATRKFDKDSAHNIFSALTYCIKSMALMTVTMAALVYALRLQYFSRMQIFGTFSILFFFEIFLYVFYVITKKERASKTDIESIEEAKSFFEQEKLVSDIEHDDAGFIPENPVRNSLETALDFFNPWLFKFIDKFIDLLKIDKNNTRILSTGDLNNLRTSDENTVSLIVNLYKLNHFRKVNQYFLEVYRKLKPSGYFIGKVSTIHSYKEKVKERYPKYFSEVFYTLHFIFFRIFPKLPFTRQIYFALTLGRNRLDRVFSSGERFLYFSDKKFPQGQTSQIAG